jgi:hypothetical protein
MLQHRPRYSKQREEVFMSCEKHRGRFLAQAASGGSVIGFIFCRNARFASRFGWERLALQALPQGSCTRLAQAF